MREIQDAVVRSMVVCATHSRFPVKSENGARNFIIEGEGECGESRLIFFGRSPTKVPLGRLRYSICIVIIC